MPLTRNHWEATYLAEDYPLARGWHRQLDRKVNPLFYDSDHPLTPDAYRDWLRDFTRVDDVIGPAEARMRELGVVREIVG